MGDEKLERFERGELIAGERLAPRCRGVDEGLPGTCLLILTRDPSRACKSSRAGRAETTQYERRPTVVSTRRVESSLFVPCEFNKAFPETTKAHHIKAPSNTQSMTQ